MIYLLMAIGLSSGGGSTVQCSTVQYSTIQCSAVHIYTQTIHRTTKRFGRVRAVPHLG